MTHTIQTVLQLPIRAAARPAARSLVQSCVQAVKWGQQAMTSGLTCVAVGVHTALTALGLLVRLTETHGDVALAVLTHPDAFLVADVLSLSPLLGLAACCTLRAPMEVGSGLGVGGGGVGGCNGGGPGGGWG
jgi:hypothetical protein